jgi:hypothetical protein
MTPAVGLPMRGFKESVPSQLVMGMRVMMGMKYGTCLVSKHAKALSNTRGAAP